MHLKDSEWIELPANIMSNDASEKTYWQSISIGARVLLVLIFIAVGCLIFVAPLVMYYKRYFKRSASTVSSSQRTTDSTISTATQSLKESVFSDNISDVSFDIIPRCEYIKKSMSRKRTITHSSIYSTNEQHISINRDSTKIRFDIKDTERESGETRKNSCSFINTDIENLQNPMAAQHKNKHIHVRRTYNPHRKTMDIPRLTLLQDIRRGTLLNPVNGKTENDNNDNHCVNKIKFDTGKKLSVMERLTLHVQSRRKYICRVSDKSVDLRNSTEWKQ